MFRYGGEYLQFVEVNVGRYPDVARRYRISTASNTAQLPTIMHIERGKEVRRLPTIDSDGTVRKCTMRMADLERYFSLEELSALSTVDQHD